VTSAISPTSLAVSSAAFEARSASPFEAAASAVIRSDVSPSVVIASPMAVRTVAAVRANWPMASTSFSVRTFAVATSVLP
jgi:hypothetical protein